MKILLFVFILVSSQTDYLIAQPIQLNNFDELLSSLKEGRNVRAVIYYSKCRLVVDGKEEKSNEVVGGMGLNTFEYFAKATVNNDRAFIASSETVLIFHPRYGHVLNYVKLRIYDDDSVEIIARYLDPITYEIKMDETFYSSIAYANNDAAVYFYAD